MELYLARDGNNVMGYYIAYRGHGGNLNFDITIDLTVYFVHQDEGAAAASGLQVSAITLNTGSLIATSSATAWGAWLTLVSQEVTDGDPLMVDIYTNPTYNEAPQSGGDRIILDFRTVRKRSGQTDVVVREKILYPRYISSFNHLPNNTGYEWPDEFQFLQNDHEANDTIEVQVRMSHQDSSRTKTATFTAANTEINFIK